MPGHKQTTVESVITERGMGRSASADMSTIYSSSPIHKGELTEASVKAMYQDLALDGVANDGGHTFGEQSRDYVDNGAPNMGDVETGGGGLPASPFVPNPMSPGPGSLNPADIPEPPEGYGQEPNNTPFAGVGSKENPATTSAQVQGHTLGDYGLGDRSGKA